jgi:acylphosphatase
MLFLRIQLIRSYRITVKGRVQGVGYRFNAQAAAHKLDLTGFVRNEHNGNVYIHAEGEEQNIHDFIEWCNTGPRQAEVSEVISQEQTVQGYTTFEIKR